MKRTYNLSTLMKKAWKIFKAAAKKSATATFSEALKKAWAWLKVQDANKAIIEAAAAALGIEEEYRSWYGWKLMGRQVIHTSKATFQVVIADPTTKSGTRVESFYIYSDTQVAPAA